MIFALVGNQNCGKTTLFNQLTGSNQRVGNFPGVTVDQKMGVIKGRKDCTVVDLPGIYSLRTYSNPYLHLQGHGLPLPSVRQPVGKRRQNFLNHRH